MEAAWDRRRGRSACTLAHWRAWVSRLNPGAPRRLQAVTDRGRGGTAPASITAACRPWTHGILESSLNESMIARSVLGWYGQHRGEGQSEDGVAVGIVDTASDTSRARRLHPRTAEVVAGANLRARQRNRSRTWRPPGPEAIRQVRTEQLGKGFTTGRNRFHRRLGRVSTSPTPSRRCARD